MGWRGLGVFLGGQVDLWDVCQSVRHGLLMVSHSIE